jgi:hypothetical protein
LSNAGNPLEESKDEEDVKSIGSPEVNDKEKTNAKEPYDENIRVKLVDMGNGCWTYHHFTDLIQTR